MSSSSPPDLPASPELDSAEPAPGLWRRIVGDIDWQPPGWMAPIAARISAHPRRFVGGLAALLLLALLAYWLVTRPKVVPPDAVRVTVHAPVLTDYAATPKKRVDTLRLRFSGSAAPIKDVGGPPKGLHMEPTLPGTWQWTDDRNLVFTPADDWPVDQRYEIQLDPDRTVAHGVVLAEDKFEAASAPFAARIANSEFYQDPIDPTLKKGVFEIAFSHPVDAATLQSRVRLTLKDGAGVLVSRSRNLYGDSTTVHPFGVVGKGWNEGESSAGGSCPEGGGNLSILRPDTSRRDFYDRSRRQQSRHILPR